MALITEPADYTNDDTFDETLLNELKNPIYNEFNGNIDNANVKTGAAIEPAKIADTALVQTNTVAPGTQTVSRPTEFTAGALCIDTSSSNRTAATAISSGALTLAIVDANKQFQVYTFGSAAASAVIATITGGTVDKLYTFHITNTDNPEQVTFTHTAAHASNNIKMKDITSRVCNALTNRIMGTFLYGDPIGAGVNQFWEI